MVKLKQEDYVSLHKLVTGLNERAVWERLRKDETVDEICRALPDEFHDWTTQVATELKAKFYDIYLETFNDFIRIKTTLPIGASRKQFALEIVKTRHPGILFSYLDNKPVHEIIWDMVRPEANRP
jgi:RNA ligase